MASSTSERFLKLTHLFYLCLLVFSAPVFSDTTAPVLNFFTLSKTEIKLWDLGDPNRNIIEINIQTYDETGTIPPTAWTNAPAGIEGPNPSSDPGQPTANFIATMVIDPGAPAGTYTITLDPLRDFLGNLSSSSVTRSFTVATSPPADSDGDSVVDNLDAFPYDPTETLDSDGDGVGNNADAFPYNSGESADSDGDGIGNNADAFPYDSGESVDGDGDGVGNNADAFPNDSNETDDSDGDGIGNNADAFPLDADETVDTDGDGIGNNADDDDDDDGVVDPVDQFPLDMSETIDTDSDGIGDNADADDDNDGVSDIDDAFPLDADEVSDWDLDGIGNNTDPDDDGDGYSDIEEIDGGTDPLDANDSPSEGNMWHLFKAANDQKAKDAYEGICPLPTDACMNIENHQACLDVEADCDSEIVFLESCPLQFACPTESQSSP